MLAFGRRVGEPVGFDDGPNDDDRQRNPCQTIVGKHKQQEQKTRRRKDMTLFIYIVCQIQQLLHELQLCTSKYQ